MLFIKSLNQNIKYLLIVMIVTSIYILKPLIIMANSESITKSIQNKKIVC